MAQLPTFPDLRGKVGLVMCIGQTRVQGSNIWGNGAAMARALSQNGVKQFGCDSNMEGAEFTASCLREGDCICDIMTANATSSTDVCKAVNAVLQNYDRIGILVNNVDMT